MAINVKGVVRYDGTDFAGWQIQPDQRTVQGSLEDALTRIAGERVVVNGASRTDAGVHALGQTIQFRWNGPKTLDALRRSLSQMLGPEIRVKSLDPVDDNFHATISAIGKRYAYVICTRREPDPFSHRHALWYPHPIDWARLAELTTEIVGTRDFAGFTAAGSQATTTVRTVRTIEIKRGPVVGPIDDDSHVRIEFEGDGFLYKMIRNLTGTLLEIARGKKNAATIAKHLASPGPYCGYTAPARGLFLLRVFYDE